VQLTLSVLESLTRLPVSEREAILASLSESQAARPALDLELGPDRPDVLWPERRLCPDQLALVPRHALGCGWGCVFVIMHGQTPQLLRVTIMRDRFRATHVSFRTTCDVGCLPTLAVSVGIDPKRSSPPFQWYEPIAKRDANCCRSTVPRQWVAEKTGGPAAKAIIIAR
jgi:hypothetical protein